MKKISIYSMTMIMVVIMSVSFVSCGGDKDGGSGISGLYYYESGGGGRTVYNFIGGSRVEFYGSLTKDKNDTWFGEHGEAFPYKSGWYYWSGNKHIYNYIIEDGVLIIDGDRVMTIEGDRLYYVNLDVILYKWN